MESLNARDRELVALGAALGSNCVPCIEYHIPEARKAGLSDQEIGEAVRLADKVRQVPAAKVLKTAMTMIEATDGVPQSHPVAAGPCCV
jgi:AhpD family alkylhydroperoxidase